MKYAVMSELIVSTPAQQDNFHAGVLSLIKEGTTWEKVGVQKTQSEDKKPAHQTEVRFHKKADADSLYDYIKTRMILIPVLSGRVTKHLCYHDEGGKLCQFIEEYEQ